MLRAWLHRHGHHRWCREVRVVDHYDFNPKWLVGKDGSNYDITAFGGEPIYRTAHQ